MTEKKPQTVTIPIVTDPDAVTALQQAKAALDGTSKSLLESFVDRAAQEASLTGEDVLDARKRLYDEDVATLENLKAAVKTAEEAVLAASETFTFRSIGYKAWRAMKAAHPSKKDGYAFDEDSIAASLLRDASHEPRLSAERVEEILTSPDWSEGEVHLLLQAAVAAQS